MALEIERKFLIAGEQWRDAAHSPRRLRQGYLGGEGYLQEQMEGLVGELRGKSAPAGLDRGARAALLRPCCLAPTLTPPDRHARAQWR